MTCYHMTNNHHLRNHHSILARDRATDPHSFEKPVLGTCLVGSALPPHLGKPTGGLRSLPPLHI
ncbi:hypothetical protein [Phormidium sp. CCY1219]|uniref:hypothetical protein n=1 Tax=Phormidium sp. CCY1219 TaxID=2886104 RepID=UPI002D1EA03A|nr:hypothetical protein [Phormidium sp. CCY1219]MEB3826785.1 hypothetical protein [Phormidium sp. CCY1219]